MIASRANLATMPWDQRHLAWSQSDDSNDAPVAVIPASTAIASFVVHNGENLPTLPCLEYMLDLEPASLARRSPLPCPPSPGECTKLGRSR